MADMPIHATWEGEVTCYHDRMVKTILLHNYA